MIFVKFKHKQDRFIHKSTKKGGSKGQFWTVIRFFCILIAPNESKFPSILKLVYLMYVDMKI